jgi:hypothetical protein
MKFRPSLITLAALAYLLVLPTSSTSAGKPEDDLAAIIKGFYAKSFATDWRGIETLPAIQWARLPPTLLQNCLADGGCFTREGRTTIGGRNITVVATGAREIVSNLYLRNAAAPFGEAALLAALGGLSVSADLVRCPIPGTAGGTNWYRLKSSAIRPGILAVQTSCSGRPCEGFVLSQSEDLPSLQPAQLKLYSEQCSGPPAERKPVATVLPHEALAGTLAALIPLASGPPLFDWTTLRALNAPISWISTAPQKMDNTFKNDANPFAQSASLLLSGRKFSVLATGSETHAKVIHIDELNSHPRGEHLLGIIYSRGLTVQLVRCGPVYTESTNNWYSIKSARTHPVMLRQSIRYDGNQVQDGYELRLGNALPERDPRDRDPGVAGCR